MRYALAGVGARRADAPRRGPRLTGTGGRGRGIIGVSRLHWDPRQRDPRCLPLPPSPPWGTGVPPRSPHGEQRWNASQGLADDHPITTLVPCGAQPCLASLRHVPMLSGCARWRMPDLPVARGLLPRWGVGCPTSLPVPEIWSIPRARMETMAILPSHLKAILRCTLVHCEHPYAGAKGLGCFFRLLLSECSGRE